MLDFSQPFTSSEPPTMKTWAFSQPERPQQTIPTTFMKTDPSYKLFVPDSSVSCFIFLLRTSPFSSSASLRNRKARKEKLLCAPPSPFPTPMDIQALPIALPLALTRSPLPLLHLLRDPNWLVGRRTNPPLPHAQVQMQSRMFNS
jgi:hypothetical protein